MARKKLLLKLVDGIVEYSQHLSRVLFVAGILCIAVLPCFERRIKFDEKSLMVGAAWSTLRSRSVSAITEAMQQAVEAEQLMNHGQYGHKHMLQHMASMGLKPYLSGGRTSAASSPPCSDTGYCTSSSHDYSSSSHDCTSSSHDYSSSSTEGRAVPCEDCGANGTTSRGEATGSAGSSNCSTIHGILQAPQGDGKESILVVTPLRLLPGDTHTSAASALLLGAATMLISHLSQVTWLAKDVIWVVPLVGPGCSALEQLDAWVHRYQMEAVGDGLPFGRSGVMQQAVVVELGSADFNVAEVLVEGYDGQLPKLDTFQLLATCTFTLTTSKLVMRDQQHQPKWLLDLLSDQEARDYAQKLMHMLQFAWQQAKGLPSGPHAAFKPYLVDSATLRLGHSGSASASLSAARPPPPSLVDLHLQAIQVAECLELALRSLNNLEERFHHSFFLYLLTGTRHFITVEVYIIPLVALIAALLLKAVFIKNHLATTTGKEVQGVANHIQSLRSWAYSIHLVLLLVATSTGLGLLLRALMTSNSQAGPTWELLKPTSIGNALASIASPYSSLTPMEQLILAASLVVLLLAVLWEALPSHDRGSQCTLAAAPIAADLRSSSQPHQHHPGGAADKGACNRDLTLARTQVAMLCFDALALAGMASFNWALAYVTAAILVLLSGVWGSRMRPAPVAEAQTRCSQQVDGNAVKQDDKRTGRQKEASGLSAANTHSHEVRYRGLSLWRRWTPGSGHSARESGTVQTSATSATTDHVAGQQPLATGPSGAAAGSSHSLSCANGSSAPSSSGRSAATKMLQVAQVLWQWWVLIATSPPVLVMAMGLGWHRHVLDVLSWPSMQWLVCHSRITAYVMFWSTYVPTWCMALACRVLQSY